MDGHAEAHVHGNDAVARDHDFVGQIGRTLQFAEIDHAHLELVIHILVTAGSGLLILAAPAPAATGSVALALNLGSATADQSCTSGLPASTGAALPWLRALNGACATSHDRDPAARASFGIYSPETRKTVHARELF